MKSSALLTLTLVALLSTCAFGQPSGSQAYNHNLGGSGYKGSPPSAAELALANSLWPVRQSTLKKARALVDANDVQAAVALFDKVKELDAKYDRLMHVPPNPIDQIEEEKLVALKRYPAAAALFESGALGVIEEAWLTILYWRMGDKPMAREAFRKAFYNADNLGLPSHDGLGEFLALNGVTDETMQATALIFIGHQINGDGESRPFDEIQLLQEAEDLLPSNPFIGYTIGEVYYHGSHYKEALPWLKAAEPGLKHYLEQQDCVRMRSGCQQALAAKKTDG